MNTNGKIPLVDLVTPHQELEEELVSVFRSALRTAGFIGGPMVEDFEREFAEFCDVRRCVGVGSGTDALRFALIAAGVEPGDTVVTVPNTFIATTEAISQAGARPDFVDIDAHTYTMDPEKLRSYLETECTRDVEADRMVSKRTGSPVAAVVPVHLYGQMADMDPILDLATRYRLIVIEDACQAHGAEYFSKKEARWRKAGSMGRAAAFSFYPGKNLGACGEAGAMTTGDEQLAWRCQMLRDHGQARKYCHEVEGYNGRLDAIQAGILRAKLRHLREWNNGRRGVARRYGELFGSLRGHVGLPYEPTWAKAVYHLYVIRVQNRDELRAYLDGAGIGTGIHYPIPLHLQTAYRHLGFRKDDFPVSERTAGEVLSLPMYPQLEVDQQHQVIQRMREFIGLAPRQASPVSGRRLGRASAAACDEPRHFGSVAQRSTEDQNSVEEARRRNKGCEQEGLGGQMATQISAIQAKSEKEHLQFALERITGAEIQREPFPHIIVEGLFPDAFFKSLLGSFPDRIHFERVEYPGTGHSRTAATYHDYGLACRDLASQPVFADVHALFKSEGFTRALLEKFSRQLDNGFWPIPVEKHRHFKNGSTDFMSVFDLQIDLSGYAIPPHPDVPSKIVTFQFFLPADDSLGEYGTLLCKPKNGRPTVQRAWIARTVGSLVTRAAESFDLTATRQYKWLERASVGLSLGIGDNRSWLPWNLFDVVRIAPALPNFFMAFPPNAISYHAARFDISASSAKWERPVVRGFIRAGSNTKNWIQPHGM